MPRTMRFKGRGGRSRREPGVMNKLEQSYAAHLELRKLAGEELSEASLRASGALPEACQLFSLAYTAIPPDVR